MHKLLQVVVCGRAVVLDHLLQHPIAHVAQQELVVATRTDKRRVEFLREFVVAITT